MGDSPPTFQRDLYFSDLSLFFPYISHHIPLSFASLITINTNPPTTHLYTKTTEQTGFLLNKSSVPAALRFLSLLSYFNYAYEALAVNEFHGSPLEFIFTTPINSTKLPPLRTKGDGVLKTFGFDAARADLDQVALVILFLGATTAAYVALATADETAVQMRRR